MARITGHQALKVGYAEINAMSNAEVARINTALRGMANRRIKRLEDTGLVEKSRAYARVADLLTNGRFRSFGTKLYNRRNEWKVLVAFLGDPSSKDSGVKKEIKSLADRFRLSDKDKEINRLYEEIITRYGDSLRGLVPDSDIKHAVVEEVYSEDYDNLSVAESIRRVVQKLGGVSNSFEDNEWQNINFDRGSVFTEIIEDTYETDFDGGHFR